MPTTPITSIRLPLALKAKAQEKCDNLTTFIIEAIILKLQHESEKAQHKRMGGTTHPPENPRSNIDALLYE